MRNCYIHSAVSISLQHTFDSEDFLADIIIHNSKKAKAIYPNYKDFISTIAARRMESGVKMGVIAATKALNLAELNQPDAIITGTGMGCIADTEKFLNSIIDNNEAYLTPTSFIQSTHNTLSANIALILNCHGYNNTYAHASLSFESALIDAKLLLEQEEANHILVGGTDELGNEFVDYVQMIEASNDHGINVPFGEGASFTVLSSEKKPNTIQLLDITTENKISNDKLKHKIKSFLDDNKLNFHDIDAIILGNNGDTFDYYYEQLTSSLFVHASQIHYKHLIGEFYTASAFGFWLGIKILQKQHIPKAVLKNVKSTKPIKIILIYNQFKGENHSFILLKKC
ncbi:beta-ketoacyl synthase chain length factor [Confluentibacter flavum]|uniref:3-oxoacyl-ACP synthase n=1 Tax=Confluentibacter flavum TaxID=1909700 RepID=A0A2N3HKN5_9FLAO|nr:beta-ketoacyl synthase chain length factor [Confluentibacter flavum]PKQ45483.1 3-oxoacyl-ACP synthase [Confluentibacter flavum]